MEQIRLDRRLRALRHSRDEIRLHLYADRVRGQSPLHQCVWAAAIAQESHESRHRDLILVPE